MKGWDRFVVETMREEGYTNFRFPFDKLCKKYGRAYMEYLRIAYSAKDNLSDKDFCFLNHCPLAFLRNRKKYSNSKEIARRVS